MNRHLISIGIALVDAGARPDVIRWVIDLLRSFHRAYLPVPRVAVDQRRKILMQFRVDSKALVLIIVSPGMGCWVKLGPFRCVDQGNLGGPESADTLGQLLEWLLDDRDRDSSSTSETAPAHPTAAGRI
jgi:hypothetical protein